jgi:hypothetical protein
VRWLGTLTAVYILGNTVRAEVAVQGRHILVDRLNGCQDSRFDLNEEVGLVVGKNACTVLAQ